MAVTSDTPITSAQAQIQQTLDTYGLGSLTQWAWDKVKAGENLDQIILEMRQRPEYQARFPAMQQLSKQGRAMNESQYIALEDSYRQVLQAAGMPVGFYDQPDDFSNWILQDVSPSELKSRTDLAQQAIYQTTPEFRQHLHEYYGVSDGGLAAYFLDPVRALPVLQQQSLAAQAGTSAQLTGYGPISKAEAENLANLGLSQTNLDQGFSALAREEQVFRNLPGEAGDEIGRGEQFSAAFEGNGASQLDIERRQAQRKAAFGGGGEFATSQGGYSGIGNANPG